MKKKKLAKKSLLDVLSARMEALLSDPENAAVSSGDEGPDCGEWEDLDPEEERLHLDRVESPRAVVSSAEPFFPLEINEKLKEDIKVLNIENANLRKSLEEAEEELKEREESRGKLGLPASLKNLERGTTQEYAMTKIVELSKKLRETNALLVAAQNGQRLAEAKLAIHRESEAKKMEKPKEASKDKVTELENQIKELNDRLSSTSIKLCEARNQVQQHKHELKLAQKAMVSEIGDNASLLTVQAEGWRGRAQQILALQKRVAELNDRLSQTTIPAMEKSAMSIQMIEKAQDKERIANLSKELEELKAQLQEHKTRGEQSRARVKVLSNELSVLRTKYETLSTKNEADTKLLTSLSYQIGTISEKSREREEALTSKFEDQMASLRVELKQERTKADQFQKIVLERDSRIAKLEDRLNDQMNNRNSAIFPRSQETDNRPVTRSSFFDRPSSRLSMYSDSYVQSVDLERMRLMELVTVLNKRLEEDRKSLDKVQDQLRSERQKSGRLEGKVGRLELERVGKSYRRPGGQRAETASAQGTQALKDRCELLEEKCLALETRLDRLRHEKEEDSRIYVRMVEEARTAFREYIRKSHVSTPASLP